MAGELECDGVTGATVYFQLRNSIGQIWRVDTTVFEAYATADISHYNIPGVEQGSASGFYIGTMPAAVAGEYNVVAKQQAGGGPAETDRTIATGDVQWSGTAVISLNAVGVTSNVKVNQALAKFQFGMTDATTHAPKTLLTVTCTRSIDGGAYAAGTLANVGEVSNGTYTVDFGAGDLNGKVIMLRCTATGADDTFERIVTQP